MKQSFSSLDDESFKIMMEWMTAEIPLRAMVMMSGGNLSLDKIEEILKELNHSVRA